MKICFYTGNRGEFSLIKPLIEKLNSNKLFKTQILVSGSHLEKDFGETINEITKTGLNIDFKTSKLSKINNNFQTAFQISDSIKESSIGIDKLKPDFLVIYGDRFEAFGACIAASQSGVPVIHIEGGDVTEGGCYDDNVRHAMTKLSHLHCVTNPNSLKRVINLGEEEWRISNIGLPCLDGIYEKQYATKDEVIKNFNLDLNKPIIVFTQHPVASEIEKLKEHILASTSALKEMQEKHSAQIICTFPNSDHGSEIIIKELESLSKNNQNINLFKSLGGYLYYGLLALSLDDKNIIISAGNSSSGIKETPTFKCPHLNIGNRQKGRFTSQNIINSKYSKNEIYQKLSHLIEPENRKKLRNESNPYWNNGAGENFENFLTRISVKNREQLLVKKIKNTKLNDL
jgi:UDP-hydrolysing UDP-N-acetyl-D-glucosamine 2-epimerase